MTTNATASRRGFALGLAAAALIRPAFAQQQTAATATPPSVITNPPRQWGHRAPPDIYPDPDIIVIDPSFKQYLLGHHRDPSCRHRLPVERRSGMVQRGPILCVQRRAG